jgi:hypothetical protein
MHLIHPVTYLKVVWRVVVFLAYEVIESYEARRSEKMISFLP